MATEKEIAGGASGALGGGLSGSTVSTATTLGAINPILGVGYALTMAGMGAVKGFEEEQAKALDQANKQALKQDKQAQKRANKKTQIAQKGKQDDALLASSMGGASTQATGGTQYDRFQAETFGLG